MKHAAIALTRAFNRTAAERIGVLTDRFLGRVVPGDATRVSPATRLGHGAPIILPTPRGADDTCCPLGTA